MNKKRTTDRLGMFSSENLRAVSAYAMHNENKLVTVTGLSRYFDCDAKQARMIYGLGIVNGAWTRTNREGQARVNDDETIRLNKEFQDFSGQILARMNQRKFDQLRGKKR